MPPTWVRSPTPNGLYMNFHILSVHSFQYNQKPELKVLAFDCTGPNSINTNQKDLPDTPLSGTAEGSVRSG